MDVGVVIDDWKLPTFTKFLDDDGFEYENKGQVRPGYIALVVEATVQRLPELEHCIKKANCAAVKPSKLLH